MAQTSKSARLDATAVTSAPSSHGSPSPGSPSPGTPSPGLLDPIFDSQTVFRCLLDALAAPGTVLPFPALTDSIGEASAEALAILLTLADADTPVWLPPAMKQDAVALHLAFHGGIRIAEERQAASFAVIDAAAFATDVFGFPTGTPEYPDRSTTLIIACQSLTEEVRDGLKLVGPGIKTHRRLGIDPLPDGLVEQMARNTASYPLGLDMLFTAPGQVAAIPRSTRLEV